MIRHLLGSGKPNNAIHSLRSRPVMKLRQVAEASPEPHRGDLFHLRKPSRISILEARA